VNSEKIIKAENKKEILRIFRKLTASGVVDGDKAAEIIMRDYPHFFRQPTKDEIKQTFNSAMNDAIRARAQQTNRLADALFRGPTDKQPT
jgi:lysophospholipase L1-like esterase